MKGQHLSQQKYFSSRCLRRTFARQHIVAVALITKGLSLTSPPMLKTVVTPTLSVDTALTFCPLPSPPPGTSSVVWCPISCQPNGGRGTMCNIGYTRFNRRFHHG